MITIDVDEYLQHQPQTSRNENLRQQERKERTTASNRERGTRRRPRTYTRNTLNEALHEVITNNMRSTEAIRHFGIPRRTFYRHLRSRREMLGIRST